jgi:hypothetical protein
VLVEICSSRRRRRHDRLDADRQPGVRPRDHRRLHRRRRLLGGADVLTVLDAFTLSPNGGLVIRDWPPNEGFDQDVSKGLAIRLTAPRSSTAASR